MSAELIESTERAPGLPRAIDSDRCERECDARSETRFPGAPRSPALDRTRGLVSELMEIPQAAPVIASLTHGDEYRTTALRELMCLAFAAGANDALRQVRK